MKKVLMFMFVGLLMTSCSKDDSPTPTPTPTPVDSKPLKVINKATGEEINDGDIVVFNTNSNTNDVNALKFYFKNTSSSSMNVRTTFVEYSGTTDALQIQYCIGDLCLNGIDAGNNYPANGEPVLTVPANGTLGDGIYKIQNTASPVSPATSIDYVFEVYQYDADLNKVGNKVTFTYRYSPL